MTSPASRPRPGLPRAALLALALVLAGSGVVAASPALGLGPGEVARVDERVVTLDDYLAYVGRVHARSQEGGRALQGLVARQVVEHAAAERGVDASAEDVAGVRARMEARALEATGGEHTLAGSLGYPEDSPMVDEAMRLMALQQNILAHDQGLPEDAQVARTRLDAWLKVAMAEARLVVHAPDDPVAARTVHGPIPRVELGARIDAMLPAGERSETLTELMGTLVIDREAARRGVVLDDADIATELAERQALLDRRPEAKGLAYADVVAQTDGLTLDELVATPKFRAEVLLRLLVDAAWDDGRLGQVFQARRPTYQRLYHDDVTFEEARAAVRQDVRQDVYRQLMAESRIERLF